MRYELCEAGIKPGVVMGKSHNKLRRKIYPNGPPDAYLLVLAFFTRATHSHRRGAHLVVVSTHRKRPYSIQDGYPLKWYQLFVGLLVVQFWLRFGYYCSGCSFRIVCLEVQSDR